MTKQMESFGQERGVESYNVMIKLSSSSYVVNAKITSGACHIYLSEIHSTPSLLLYSSADSLSPCSTLSLTLLQ